MVKMVPDQTELKPLNHKREEQICKSLSSNVLLEGFLLCSGLHPTGETANSSTPPLHACSRHNMCTFGLIVLSWPLELQSTFKPTQNVSALFWILLASSLPLYLFLPLLCLPLNEKYFGRCNAFCPVPIFCLFCACDKGFFFVQLHSGDTRQN